MPKTSKNTNTTLQSAKKEKNDEFYTQLADIENECAHYRGLFKDKIILCNCDDPRVSNFFRYFYGNFCLLGIKKLIAVCYKNLNPDLFSQNKDEKAVYCIYDGNGRKDDSVDNKKEFLKRNEWGTLKGDGDFRSAECIGFLKESDIVVTNPPFSLFREYIAQLVEYDKKFLVIGNMNAITYKEIFKLVKENKVWVGYKNIGTDMRFIVPDHYETVVKVVDIINGKKIARSAAIWFTNLPVRKRQEKLLLPLLYTQEEYPKYDNYNAVEVSHVANIPANYNGVMGVPVSFLDKYNPEQFEILGSDYDVKQGLLPELVNPNWTGKLDRGYINGERLYSRILIRHKKGANE